LRKPSLHKHPNQPRGHRRIGAPYPPLGIHPQKGKYVSIASESYPNHVHNEIGVHIRMYGTKVK